MGSSGAGGPIASKINLEAGTSPERPEAGVGAPRQARSGNPRAASNPSQSVSPKYTPLAGGQTEAQQRAGERSLRTFHPAEVPGVESALCKIRRGWGW